METTIYSSMASSSLALYPPKPERVRKKLKLEQKTPETTDIAKLRQLIRDHKRKCQEELKDVYRDNLVELYYLQNGLNYMDLLNVKKKPNVHLKKYLRSFKLEDDECSSDAAESPITIKNEPSGRDSFDSKQRTSIHG